MSNKINEALPEDAISGSISTLGDHKASLGKFGVFIDTINNNPLKTFLWGTGISIGVILSGNAANKTFIDYKKQTIQEDVEEEWKNIENQKIIHKKEKQDAIIKEKLENLEKEIQKMDNIIKDIEGTIKRGSEGKKYNDPEWRKTKEEARKLIQENTTRKYLYERVKKELKSQL